MAVRPLWSIAYRGPGYALVGAVAGALTVPFGVVAAALVPGSSPLRAAAGLAAMVAVAAVAGLPRPARRGYVAFTNGLLGTDLPAPGRPRRVGTAAWAVLHTGSGGLVVTAAGLLVAGGPTLIVPWLTGGDHIAYFGLPLHIAGGWAGVWVLPLTAAQLAVVAALCPAATVCYRTVAPALLGPDAADRLAAERRRAEGLAQRNRLARELHDSIGHTLTASTIQAAAARRLMDADPALARRALGSIEESSRTALEDLDHVLGVLREDPAPREPGHTLDDLDALLDRVRHTGTEVHAEVTGGLRRVPAAVSREAYRIVQEGLTNALRHAAAAPVTVRVAIGAERLDVTVTNPVPDGVPDPAGGRGLAGVAERVRLLRGEASAGADPNGHWRLAAWLPLRSAP